MQSLEPAGAGAAAAEDEYGVDWGPRRVLFGVFLLLVGYLLVGLPTTPVIDKYGESSVEAERALFAAEMIWRLLLIVVVFKLAGGRDDAWGRLGLRTPSGMTLQRIGGYAAVGFFSAWIVLLSYESVVNAFGVDALKPSGQVDDIVFDHTLLVVLFAIIVVGAAPITEELLFRGFIFGGLRKAWGVWPAVLLSSALFGVAHITSKVDEMTDQRTLEYGLIIPTFIIAVVLALTYHRSKTLYASFAVHLLFNSISFLGLILLPGSRG
jgi:membrane protease YdiL (CAAX protease family)